MFSKCPLDHKLVELDPVSFLSSTDVRNTPPLRERVSQTTTLKESDNRNYFLGRNLQNYLKVEYTLNRPRVTQE